MQILKVYKHIFNKVLDFYLGFDSRKWGNLIGIVLLTFVFSFLLIWLFNQITSIFSWPESSLTYYENINDSYFATIISQIYIHLGSILGISLVTLSFISSYLFSVLKDEKGPTFMEFISKLRSNSVGLYFLLVLAIYFFNRVLFEVGLDYQYSYFSYGMIDENYYARFFYLTLMLLVPLMTILGSYSLIHFERFSFSALTKRKYTLVALLLFVITINGIFDALLWFINSYLGSLLGFLYNSPDLFSVIFGSLKVLVFIPFTVAKLVALSREPEEGDDIRVINASTQNELLDID